MRDPRFTRLADVLVNYSVGVKKGQLVRISGPPVSHPLVVTDEFPGVVMVSAVIQ